MNWADNESMTCFDENPRFRQVPDTMFKRDQIHETLSCEGEDKFENIGNNSQLIQNYPAIQKYNVVSVFDVACYVLYQIKQCTTMKLQKLLYYCQAWYLVWNDKPLFRENIEAWANGPVVRELYNFHKGLFNIDESMMSLGNPNHLSKEQKDDIDSVLKAYKDKSSQWLIDQTHSERPWRDARRGMQPNERGHKIITHAAMAEYYSSLYEQEK